jgi:hypothetical protein
LFCRNVVQEEENNEDQLASPTQGAGETLFVDDFGQFYKEKLAMLGLFFPQK